MAGEVVALASPSPSDDTTVRYIAQANQELQGVVQTIGNLQSQIAGLQSQLATFTQRQSELNRMIADLQNP